MMKLIRNMAVYSLALVAAVSVSMAQASTITITSASVNAGDPATIHLDWDNESEAYRSVSADLKYEPTVLISFDLTDCPAAGYTTNDGYFGANCTDQGGGIIRAGWARITGETPAGRLGTIVFQTDANATPGNYPVTFEVVTVDGTAPVEVPGSVTINPPPAPFFGSTPVAPGSQISMGGQIGTTIESTLTIDNGLGEDGSTLTYSCYDQDSAPVGDGVAAPVFTVSGDVTDVQLAKGELGSVVIGCNSSAVTEYNGTMICEHNGSNSGPGTSPVSYPIYCNVTAEPVPIFEGNTNGLNSMEIVEQGDADVSSTLTVNNVGDDGTTLTGECAYTGDSAITITDGSFSIAKGTPAVVTATCSGALEGSYSGSLACLPTDPQVWAGDTYDVSCTVGPPGPAVYESAPPPKSTIAMTPVEAAIVGDDIPDQLLVITNNPAEANDRDLVLLGCGADIDLSSSFASAGGIYWSDPQPGMTIAPYESASVTFSCDSSTADTYQVTYSCDYDTDGDQEPNGTASYTVTCDVREPEAEVDENPASESTLNLVVPTGSTAQGSVTLFETLDEGADGTLENCYFDDGEYLSLISDTDGVTIPSGGSINIVFEAMESADGEEYSDVLICNYTDSTGEGIEAFWYIEVTVGITAIPTLSTWGLITMFLAMLGLGGIFSRRRKLN